MRKHAYAAISAILLASTALQGCAGYGDAAKKLAPIQQAAIKGDYVPIATENAEIAKELALWERTTPAISTVRLPRDTLAPNARFERPSAAVLAQRIDLTLPPGSTYEDLVYGLNESGIPISTEASQSVRKEAAPTVGAGPQSANDVAAAKKADVPVASMLVPFNRHSGTLGELADKIAAASGLGLMSAGESLVLVRTLPWSFRLPITNQTFRKALVNDLVARGAVGAQVSASSGEVVYGATERTQHGVIEPYLERMRANLAGVTLQVAIIQVTGSGTVNRGVDWSKFQAALAPSNVFNNAYPGTSFPSSGQYPGVGGTTISGAASALSLASSAPVQMGGVQMTLGLAGAIAALDQVGLAKTRQNVELRTLSGVDVSMSDVDGIPYISGLGVTTGGTSATNTVTGSVQSDTLWTGIDMKFTPQYDAATGIVTVAVGAKQNSLTQMVSLSAGTAVGTLSEPQTQDHELTGIISTEAGAVSLIDGTKTATQTGTVNSLMGAVPYEGRTGTSRSVFFLIRSSVQRYVIDGAAPVGPEGSAPIPTASRFGPPQSDTKPQTAQVGENAANTLPPTGTVDNLIAAAKSRAFAQPVAASPAHDGVSRPLPPPLDLDDENLTAGAAK